MQIGGSGQSGLGGLPILLVVLCAGITRGTLLLLLAPEKWQLGFGLFVSCSYFAPAVHVCSYF